MLQLNIKKNAKTQINDLENDKNGIESAWGKKDGTIFTLTWSWNMEKSQQKTINNVFYHVQQNMP